MSEHNNSASDSSCEVVVPAQLLQPVERGGVSSTLTFDKRLMGDASKCLVKNVRLTSKGNVYIEIVGQGILDDRISLDDYSTIREEAIAYVTRSTVKNKRKMLEILKAGELNKDDKNATGLPVTKMDTSSVARMWYGQLTKNKNITIVQRFEMTIQTEPLEEVNLQIDQEDLFFENGKISRYVAFNFPRALYSDKVAADLKEYYKGAPTALLATAERFVVIIKQKDRTFIDMETGLFYSPEKLLSLIESKYDGVLSYTYVNDNGVTREKLAPQWLRDFYIEYLTSECEKVGEVHYRRGERDEIVIKEKIMTIMVESARLKKPKLKRLPNHEELLPLVRKQYAELDKLLALIVLNNREEYDGVFRKTVLNKVVAESNAGKTYMFSDILGKGLNIVGMTQLRALIEFAGQGSKISGITDPSILVRYPSLCIDEAGAKDYTSQENKAAANLYKGMGEGIQGRGLNMDNVTVHPKHVVALSRVQQLESTDELLNRDLELDWSGAKPLINGKREWMVKEVTKNEFKALSLWYAYDIYSECLTKTDDELEAIVRTFNSLQKNNQLLEQHKTRHVETLFKRMASALEQVDEPEEKELVIAIRHSAKIEHFTESFVFQRKSIGNDMEDLRANILNDAKLFLDKYTIGGVRSTASVGVNMFTASVYYAVPVWFSEIEKHCGFDLTSGYTSQNSLLPVEHSPYWSKLMEITLEELIDKLKVIFLSPPLEALDLNSLRDIYTAIFIKCYNKPAERIATTVKVDLGGIL